jgi:hypothetical protein
MENYILKLKKGLEKQGNNEFHELHNYLFEFSDWGEE